MIKTLRGLGYALLILALPVFLLTASLMWGFNSHWLYNYGFNKFAVSETTGLPQSELEKTADSLIKYFNSTEEYIQVSINADGRTFNLFSEEEQIHFKDVKQLVRLDYLVFFISLSVLVVLGFLLVVGDFRSYWKSLCRTLIWGSLLTIVLIIVIGVAAFFNFDNLFLQFHYLTFTNEFWSASGYMLLLFPGEFWYNTVFICIAFMVVLALIIGGVSFLFLKLAESRQLKTH